MTEAEVRALVESVVAKIAAQTGAAAVGSSSQGGSASGVPSGASEGGSTRTASVRRVALGADHGGFELKEALKGMLGQSGYNVIDCGAHSKEAVDYPDLAAAVGRKVASGEAERGVMIDGAGIGSSIAANKIKGVRAALCYNEKTILNSRQHNDANVLTLGAPFHTVDEAGRLVKLWLETAFEGGRHQKRIDKIIALDGGCGCSKS